jgi:gliding motility-associated lipoprotein GldH
MTIKKPKKMKKHSYFTFGILSVLFLISCSNDRVFEAYQGMNNLTWRLQDTVSFEMSSPLPNGPSVLAIKYNDDFPYRNLYLRFITLDSLGNELEADLINISLFESTTGNPLGKGYGSSFTKYDTLAISSEIPYRDIHFVQYMRLEDLKGIEALGLKRLK